MIGKWEYLGIIPVRAQLVKVNITVGVQFVKVNRKSPKVMKSLVPGEGMSTLSPGLSLCSWLTTTIHTPPPPLGERH